MLNMNFGIEENKSHNETKYDVNSSAKVIYAAFLKEMCLIFVLRKAQPDEILSQ